MDEKIFNIKESIMVEIPSQQTLVNNTSPTKVFEPSVMIQTSGRTGDGDYDSRLRSRALMANEGSMDGISRNGQFAPPRTADLNTAHD